MVADAGCFTTPMGVALLPPITNFKELSLWTQSGESSIWNSERPKSFGVAWRRASEWATLGFDLSGLHLAGIPPIECSSRDWLSACNYWNRHPGLGIAGVWSTGNPSTGEVDIYFYVKAPAGENQAADLGFAKSVLLDAHGLLADDKLVVRPVDFALGELWFWTHVLD